MELLFTKVFCPKFLFGAFFFSKFCLSFAISILPHRAALHLYFCTFYLSEFLLCQHHLHQCNRQIFILGTETPFPEMISSLSFWVYIRFLPHVGWNLPFFNGMFYLAKFPLQFQVKVNLYLTIRIQFLFLGWLYSIFSKFSLLDLRDFLPTFSWAFKLWVPLQPQIPLTPPNLHGYFPVLNFFLGTKFLT